jgi:hypothetical protein
MVQTYKKVLLLLLITCFTGINQSCHKKVLPTTYPNKPGIFPITFPFKQYRLKKKMNHEQTKLSLIEKKTNRIAEKNKHEALKDQEKGRKKHIKKQSPEVQKRMKKSLEESEKLRHRKTIWDRLMFWKKKEKTKMLK